MAEKLRISLEEWFKAELPTGRWDQWGIRAGKGGLRDPEEGAYAGIGPKGAPVAVALWTEGQAARVWFKCGPEEKENGETSVRRRTRDGLRDPAGERGVRVVGRVSGVPAELVVVKVHAVRRTVPPQEVEGVVHRELHGRCVRRR